MADSVKCRGVRGTKRAELWRQYEPLVRRSVNHVAYQYGGNVERDDLFQAGSLALSEALDAYDPARAGSFGFYVHRRVNGAVRDEARFATRRRARRQFDARGRDLVGREQGTKGSPEQRGPERLRHVPLEHADWRRRGVAPERHGVPAWGGGRSSMESEVMYRDFVRTLRERLSRLDQRERIAVESHDLRGKTFVETGAELGMTPGGVHRLRARALDRLRDEFVPAARS